MFVQALVDKEFEPMSERRPGGNVLFNIYAVIRPCAFTALRLVYLFVQRLGKRHQKSPFLASVSCFQYPNTRLMIDNSLYFYSYLSVSNTRSTTWCLKQPKKKLPVGGPSLGVLPSLSEGAREGHLDLGS